MKLNRHEQLAHHLAIYGGLGDAIDAILHMIGVGYRLGLEPLYVQDYLDLLALRYELESYGVVR
jgi:hypothetical protein